MGSDQKSDTPVRNSLVIWAHLLIALAIALVVVLSHCITQRKTVQIIPKFEIKKKKKKDTNNLAQMFFIFAAKKEKQ